MSNIPITVSSLAALATQELGLINAKEGNTIVFSVRCTYGAAAINPLRTEIFFSADGSNYDTIPFTFEDVDLDGLDIVDGSTFQKSFMVEMPRDGFISARVRNLDAVTAVTSILVWNNVAMRRVNIHLKIDNKGDIVDQTIY